MVEINFLTRNAVKLTDDQIRQIMSLSTDIHIVEKDKCIIKNSSYKSNDVTMIIPDCSYIDTICRGILKNLIAFEYLKEYPT